jgi:lipopolysaccharide export system protein LptA
MTNAARLAPLALFCAALAAAPAPAQQGSPFGGFKHDSGQPIEITSDSLEVRQGEQVAIFTGDVVAGQGTLRLSAERVEVFYDEDREGGETGAIRRMRAEGGVMLSNGSETAEGAWGEYDVDEGVMRMGGDVTLTQGQNAISGENLVIDLDAGTGRVEGGRVRSVFSPSRSGGN